MRWNRILRKIYKKTILTSIEGDDGCLYVIDYKTRTPYFSIRCIEDNAGGWYSAIYLYSKRKQQPFLLLVQQIISTWSTIISPKSFLVLGCAGCSIPRFLAHRFPHSIIIGIEKSKELIDIANRFFFVNQYDNFQLLNHDAFSWVEECAVNKKHSFQCVFIDLFNGDIVAAGVIKKDFLGNIYSILEDDSIAIFNVHTSMHYMALVDYSDPFQYRCAVSNKNRNVVVLVKTYDADTIRKFRKSLSQWEIKYEKLCLASSKE